MCEPWPPSTITCRCPVATARLSRKSFSKSRAVMKLFAERSAEKRRAGEAPIREADNLACQSWNERMWSDGGPIDPSPTIDQAINGGYPWLEIECSRRKTPRDVDICELRRPPRTSLHDLAGRLVCQKCKGAGKRPAARLLQLAPRQRHRLLRLTDRPFCDIRCACKAMRGLGHG